MKKKNWEVLVYSSDGHFADSWVIENVTQDEASKLAEEEVKKKHPTCDDWRLIEKE